MNIETIADIATAGSSFVALMTLWQGYRLYSKSKTDAKVNNIRQLLIRFQAVVEQLDRMSDGDLFHDISRSVVYVDDTKSMLQTLMYKLKNSKTDCESEEALLAFVKEELPSITTPITSRLFQKYNELITSTREDLVFIKTDYPALYLVFDTVMRVFVGLNAMSRTLVVNTDTWEKIIADRLSSLSSFGKDISVDTLQSELHCLLTALLLSRFTKQHDQDDINNMLAISSLVTSSFLNLDDNALLEQSKIEKSSGVKNASDYKTITDKLTCVEPAFKKVMTQAQMLDYHGEVKAFETRLNMLQSSSTSQSQPSSR
ncbi:MAG: hypothetical protein JW942_04640 [Opitutales bacterium]|nr:hypothetical protein [Opitutales bacterium]